MINDFDSLQSKYSLTHEKADKKYSMGHTILYLAKPSGKTVIDLGCGDGFFTQLLAGKASRVYGIDNSRKQILSAKSRDIPNARFILSDMFDFDCPKADIMVAPFIFGYIRSRRAMARFLEHARSHLRSGGRIVGIIDTPISSRHDNRMFGSMKVVEGGLRDGARMQIRLYDDKSKIVTLQAYYHTIESIEQALRLSGFDSVEWHKPMISRQGLRKYGSKYWKGYLDRPDIAYFTAEVSKKRGP